MKSKYFNVIKILVLFVLLIYIIYDNQNDGFQKLPPGAFNGEWAAQVITEERWGLYNIDIYKLESLSETITRVRVIDISEEIRRRPRDLIVYFFDTKHLYTVYTVEILDVFKGGRILRQGGGEGQDFYMYVDDIRIGEIMNFARLQKFEGLPRWRRRQRINELPTNEDISIPLIRTPLAIGDDLIAFSQQGVFGFSNMIQTLYHYVPQEIRKGHYNWVFESVNPHNNIIFTESDLQRIRDIAF